jgi:RHS repeat-associated protein
VYNGAGQVDSVTLAVPNAGSLPALGRPAHSYEYPDLTHTKIHVAGLTSEPNGYARQVTTDGEGRVTDDYDTAGLDTKSSWSTKDQLLTRIDPAGRETTTVYDHAERPTDTYGPAPQSCFTGQLPTQSCATGPVPHATTAYDEGMVGLATAWWSNANQAGSPVLHTTGIGFPSGYQYNDWGTAAPPGLPADNFSFRSTGEIQLPQIGQYAFRFYTDDGVRLYIDDILLLDAWGAAAGYTPYAYFTNNAVDSRHRIRIDYHENSGPAYTVFVWTPPNGTEALLPGQYLLPRYGLVTSTFDPDSKKVATEYGRPELSLPTATVVDPQGLALRTATSYEPVGTGTYLRRLTRTLPAGRDTYAGTVAADTPMAHWRLDEPSGATAADLTGRGRTATYLTGSGLPATGGLVGDADTAVSFNGSGGVVLPDRGLEWTISAEAWFKTTSSGVILGMQTSAYPTAPSSYVPVLYVGTDGKLRGEFWMGALTPLTSAVAVTDGAWHHAVLAGASSTQKLYLDGNDIGTLAGTIDSLSMSSAQIGIGWTTGYPALGTGWTYFTGSIDEVAIYHSTLSAAQVARHYASGKNGPATTTSSYYAAQGSPPSSCPGASSNQAGLLKTTTGPGTGGTSRVQEAVYDAAGRVVGSRLNADAWTCTAYDPRGRPTSVSVPAFTLAPSNEPARTVAYSYAVGGDPLKRSVSDNIPTTGASITTTVDLVGRPIATTDVWGLTTTASYDQPGRMTDTNGPGGAFHLDYDTNGRLSAQKLGGSTVALPSYNTSTGELQSVSYPTGTGNGGNGTALAITREASSGRSASFTWTGPGTTWTSPTPTSDAVTYSPAGRVNNETIDGSDTHAGDNFVYDAAGRLTHAWVTGHTLTYGFGTASCGVTNAGANTNRTSMTDNATSATYCYDAADKLTSTTDTRYPTIAYDAHGNTTTLGSQTMKYDGADRHLETVAGGSTVRYTRDAAGRIIERKVNGTVVARYGYSAAGDTADITLNASGTVIEQLYPLIGGVLLTKGVGIPDVWSYPNIHGDIIATANASGAKQGSTLNYDSFGQVLGAIANNTNGNLDYGWLGQQQRPLEHEGGLLATIEMGARQYIPGLGRFLEIDPMEGGSCNDYDYVCGDPVNHTDLDGFAKCRSWDLRCKGAQALKAGVAAGKAALKKVEKVTRPARAWTAQHVLTPIGHCVTAMTTCADNAFMALSPLLVAGLTGWGVVALVAACGTVIGCLVTGPMLGAAVIGGGWSTWQLVKTYWGPGASKHYAPLR